jgi:Ion channel
MNPLKLHPRHFWSSESGLTGLLVFILGYLIVFNTLSEFSLGRLAARLFFSLIVIAGVLTTFKQRWLHRVAIVLAVAILILSWFEEFRPGHVLAILNTGLSLLYLGFLLATLVLQVFRQGKVTGHRICGAIVVYLLLGAIWALLYQLVALTIPQAFRLAEEFAGNPDALQRQLSYFSFITLTTTGYGDITPIHPVARLLVMFEALAGQLYLAVTLARLVALAVMHQNEKK